MTYLRRLSIRSQLTILAASTIAVILFIIFFTYTMMSGMITRNHEEYVKQTVMEIQKNVTANTDVIFRLMQSISYNEDIQNFFVEKNELTRFQLYQKMNRWLSSQKELKDGILDIVVWGNNGSWLDINGGYRIISTLKTSVPPKVNSYYLGSKNYDETTSLGITYCTNSCMIFATNAYYMKSDEMFNKSIGTLFFILDPKALVGEGKYESAEPSSTEIYLLDRYHRVITSNQQIKAGQLLPNVTTAMLHANNEMISWRDKKYVVQSVELPDIQGNIVTMAPKNKLLSELLRIRRLELIILGICLLILAIPFSVIINNILFPLKKLISFMTMVKRGDLSTLKRNISLDGYMEISVMATELNSMLDQIDQLTNSLLETNTRLHGIELERKKSELAFLRSQINPHFLYNTLEVITGIAVVEGQNKIKLMTRALSSIFRYSIKGASTVPLRDEVRMIESYIQIQQVRFADRFTVRYEFTEEALAYLVPKMVLQPLIENAVYHGFEPTRKIGELVVEGFVTRGQLVIVVEDNGVGIEAARLEEIRSLLAGVEQDEQRSIGLVNVNNRIKLMYGSDYGMSIDSTVGRGTRIQLTLAAAQGEQDV